MAGGGVRPGRGYGSTDETGFEAVETVLHAAEPSPHVSGAFVSGHQWSGMVTVTNSRMEALKAGIAPGNPANLGHQTEGGFSAGAGTSPWAGI